MKKYYGILAFLVLSAVVFVFSGCSGDYAKDLAKQTFNLASELPAAANDVNKIASLVKRGDDIRVKVSKLSSPEKIVYNVEMARLLTTEAGTGIRNLANSTSSVQGNAGITEILKLLGL